MKERKYKITRVIGINIIVPFWLKCFKRFIKLDVKKYTYPKLKGYKLDTVIIDEMGYYKDYLNLRIHGLFSHK